MLVESIKLETSDMVDDRLDDRRVAYAGVKEDAVGTSAFARKALGISFMVTPKTR